MPKTKQRRPAAKKAAPSPKKAKGNPQKGKSAGKLDFVQDYIPVKDIRDGIIHTTDGRYIKIVEIEPINFLLRSSEEQYNIISSFASWLKISPMRMQFKSITRKADSDKHINMVREELSREDNEKCRELGQQYIKLIQDVGNREALTRRFFLIFQFEEYGARGASHNYTDVLSMMSTAVQTAKTYFGQCGNSLVHPEDEDQFTAEVLYMFYNRRSCVNEPFSSRVNRVVMDTMLAKGKTIGVDSVPRIRMGNFVAPRGIDLSHSKYVVMDGMYYCFLYIRKDGYPHSARGGWISSLVNAGAGIDIDVHLRREPRGRTLDKVSQKIRLNKTKLKNSQDTQTDFEELANSIQSGYFIKNGISNNNEDLFYMSIFITISAFTLEELMWRKHQMTDMMKSMDMQISDCSFQQEEGLQAVSPFLSLTKDIERKSQRNILTSGAAATYMFTSFEMSDDNGVLVGVNRHNNSLCVVDLFNLVANKSPNLTLIGTTGAGKTYLFQLLALRMRMRGVQCFVIAPLKGHEFRRACVNSGGTFIKIAPGSKDCINIMEIRETTTPEMSLIDEVDYVATDSMLAKKIQQILIFFSLLIPDMTKVEEQLLDDALVKTYAECGMTHDNDSLYVDAAHTQFKKMPILGDLHKHLQENKMTERLAIIMGRFVTGSAQSFNGQTNVDLSNKYVVLDISELGNLLAPGMFTVFDLVWDACRKDRTKRKALFLDEIWKLIGSGGNSLAANFCVEAFKISRGYGTASLASTQDLSDFFALENGKYGRAILNASKTKIVLNLEPDEAEVVREVLKLTKSECRSITQFDRGEALILQNSNKVPVMVKSSPTEHKLITTDRAELEQLLKDKQKRQAQQAAGQPTPVQPNGVFRNVGDSPGT